MIGSACLLRVFQYRMRHSEIVFLRFYITKNDRLILASEVGVVDVDPAQVAYKGRLQPGKILLVDFDEQRVVSDSELKAKYMAKYPYASWAKQVPILKKYLVEEFVSDGRMVETLLTENLVEGECVESLMSPGDELPRGASATSIGRVGADSSMDALHVEKWRSIQIPMLTLFGYTYEKIDLILRPMALSATEPLGSMGNDTPLACLSRLPRQPFDYFMQLFAQATNPAIDPLREANVMSLECPIGPEANLLQVSSAACRNRCFLDEPVLCAQRFRILQKMPAFQEAITSLDITYGSSSDVNRQRWSQKVAEDSTALEMRLDQLCQEAEAAIKVDGASLLVLTHRRVGPDTIPINSLLACATLHQYLVERKMRSEVAIVCEVGDCFEIHHFALLLGYGADAVYPYIAYLALTRCHKPTHASELGLVTKIENYRKAVHQGLLKVMSKCGISCLQSYKGAQLFQAVGVSGKVIDKCFAGTDYVLSGVGFDIFHIDAVRLHSMAFQQLRLPPLVDEASRELPDYGIRFLVLAESKCCLPSDFLEDLPNRVFFRRSVYFRVCPGEYHFRSVDHQNEFHMNSPDVIAKLQQAARSNSKVSRGISLWVPAVRAVEVTTEDQFSKGIFLQNWSMLVDAEIPRKPSGSTPSTRIRSRSRRRSGGSWSSVSLTRRVSRVRWTWSRWSLPRRS